MNRVKKVDREKFINQDITTIYHISHITYHISYDREAFSMSWSCEECKGKLIEKNGFFVCTTCGLENYPIYDSISLILDNNIEDNVKRVQNSYYPNYAIGSLELEFKRERKKGRILYQNEDEKSNHALMNSLFALRNRTGFECNEKTAQKIIETGKQIRKEIKKQKKRIRNICVLFLAVIKYFTQSNIYTFNYNNKQYPVSIKNILKMFNNCNDPSYRIKLSEISEYFSLIENKTQNQLQTHIKRYNTILLQIFSDDEVLRRLSKHSQITVSEFRQFLKNRGETIIENYSKTNQKISVIFFLRVIIMLTKQFCQMKKIKKTILYKDIVRLFNISSSTLRIQLSIC